MSEFGAKTISMPLGVVVRRAPGATKWVRWNWQAIAVLPGAAIANWELLRQEGDISEYHAATLPLDLYRGETEAYRLALSETVPSIYIILRDNGADAPEVLLATASPYEAQDYADSGEEQVEKVPMPDGLIAWVRDYVLAHHEDEEFIKRKRDKKRVDLVQDGIGDARISQTADVYRAPRREVLH